MNHFKRFKQTLAVNIFLAIFTPGVLGIVLYIVMKEYMGAEILYAMVGAGVFYVASAFVAYKSLLRLSSRPLELVWQAIWHVSPEKSNVPPPKLDTVKAGHELVSAMVSQVYDLASNKPYDTQFSSVQDSSNKVAEAVQPLKNSNILESIPLSLFILDKNWQVKDANNVALEYVNLPRENVHGRSIYDVLHMSFSSEDTLDSWLKSAIENRATDSRSWEHVRLQIDGGKTKQFDLAAAYSKDNPGGNEVVLALFDRSTSYSEHDKATSYVAMAVHELRTPLTLLRGYIEMFEDELGPDLSTEHKEFMRKMSASAQSLTAFVSNILNVARIDENQFVISLHEANWGDVLREIVKDLGLRAQVRHKNIKLTVADNLPAVAIDKVSMYEVVSNLVDNAIKYSGQQPDIIIEASQNKEGMVETTVTDHGVGIPESVIGNLFTKFYRSHRSKNAVSGSGLGLYVVKSIISAHGGNVWVKSKENEGSTFGFSLQTYASLNSTVKDADGIERQAGGWIKNHSLYRR